MPEVNGKHFAYTKAGVKKAKSIAKKTGEKMMMNKKKMMTSDGYMKK